LARLPSSTGCCHLIPPSPVWRRRGRYRESDRRSLRRRIFGRDVKRRAASERCRARDPGREFRADAAPGDRGVTRLRSRAAHRGRQRQRRPGRYTPRASLILAIARGGGHFAVLRLPELVFGVVWDGGDDEPSIRPRLSYGCDRRGVTGDYDGSG
jgi:hypothetical protein